MMSYSRPAESRVLEGVLTTVSREPADAPIEARANIAPMGPIVTDAMDELILRPFKMSTTYRNLRATGEGVFHVTDDVLLLARAAIGRVAAGDGAACGMADHVAGVVLTGACRYYELKVTDVDDRADRTTIVARVVHVGRLRDCFGLNRAMHAVLEAAILATRLHLSGAGTVLDEYERLNVIVTKTGGPRERQAMDELTAYVRSWRPAPNA